MRWLWRKGEGSLCQKEEVDEGGGRPGSAEGGGRRAAAGPEAEEWGSMVSVCVALCRLASYWTAGVCVKSSEKEYVNSRISIGEREMCLC